jgi:hypothetical protein
VTVHVALLGPDLFPALAEFARGLKSAGARVTGIGSTPEPKLRAGLRRHLDRWEQVPGSLAVEAVVEAARRAGRPAALDRLEAVEERLVLVAAEARERLELPGLSLRSARLCRDKPAMKDALRQAGLPCAESAAVASTRELGEFADRVGLPLVLKPRAGLGSLRTYRVETTAELERAARQLGLAEGTSVAVEEFIDGHEGIYDTVSVAGAPLLEFVAHYYPPVLEAISDRRVSPQIAVTNRAERASYDELRAAGRRVIQALGIGTSATHMEWFFGSKGLKISEIAARPAGERIWDLYCVADDLDLYREWGLAVSQGRVEARPSRRLATGHVQIRPDREGVVVDLRGRDVVERRCGEFVFARELPRPGRRTVPPEKGYLGNAWYRLRHPDYDALRALMDFAGHRLHIHARAAQR